MEISSILLSVFAAVVYSLSMYVKKAMKEEPQKFDVAKFLTTVIWGAIIGVVLTNSGVEITEQSVEAQFVAYAGLIAITENIVKFVLRAIKRWKHG